MAPFPIHLAPAGQGPGAYIYSYSICNLSYLDLYQHSRLATKKHVLHLSTPKKTQLTFFFPQQNTINRRRIRPSPLRHPGPSESESDRSIGPVRKETLGPLGVLDLGPGTWNASRLRDLSFHSRSGRESERVVSRHKVVVDRGVGRWVGWWSVDDDDDDDVLLAIRSKYYHSFPKDECLSKLAKKDFNKMTQVRLEVDIWVVTKMQKMSLGT